MSRFAPFFARLPRAIVQIVVALAAVAVIISFAGLRAVEWGQPWAFRLLPLVLLLPFQPLLTGQNRLAVAGAARARRGLRARLAWLPDVLRLVGLVLLVVALARPRVTHRDEIVESNGLDILLAIDTSGSMRQEDFAVANRLVNRLEVAKGVVAEFVKERPHDRIGVVVFGEEAFTHVPLTLDHDTLLSVLDQVEIGVAGSRGTAVGTAIAVSSKRLQRLDAPEKIVVLLTDGRSNAGRLSPIEAAQAAGALGIKVYTIGVGAQGGRLGFFGDDGIDEATLEQVAELTGARYFRATDTETLRQIYATIDELEPSPAKVKELVQHDELYRRALVPGLIALVLRTLLAATWLRRGP